MVTMTLDRYTDKRNATRLREKYASIQFEKAMAGGSIDPGLEHAKRLADLSHEELVQIGNAAKKIDARTNEWLYNRVENTPALKALKDDPLLANKISVGADIVGRTLANTGKKIGKAASTQGHHIKDTLKETDKLDSPEAQIASEFISGVTNVPIPPHILGVPINLVKKNLEHLKNRKR